MENTLIQLVMISGDQIAIWQPLAAFDDVDSAVEFIGRCAPEFDKTPDKDGRYYCAATRKMFKVFEVCHVHEC